MSNYQTRFDAATPEARRLFVENGTAIRETIANFYGRDFDRLSRAISKLLEKVDKGNVDHPEFLANSTGNIGEYAVQLMEGVPGSLASGVPHFLQTTLPALVQCEERLVRAVGHYYFKVRDLKDVQVKEIQKLAIESEEFRHQAQRERDEISKNLNSLKADTGAIDALKTNAEAASKKISEIRDQAVKLASGDGRGKSLESLKRQAETKLEAIDDVLAKSITARAAVDGAETELATWNASFGEADKALTVTKTKADLVLGLSSQAGLANSYLNESRKLATKSYIYSAILYATSIAAAIIAAVYVLPELQNSLKSTDTMTVERAIPLAFLRTTILAPLVYILYFTSKQISSIETIRMDYAEKAAASLAYSGYKGEMSDDGSLLERLRGSLLLKFAEHPERLLRKRPVQDRIEVEGPGFRASSSSAEAVSLKKVEDEVDE